jgi:general secretion pathway protein E
MITPEMVPHSEDAATLPASAVRVSDALTAEFLDWHGLIPIRHDASGLLVGCWKHEPDPHGVDELALLFGVTPRIVTVSEEAGREALQRLYGAGTATAEGVIAGLDADLVQVTSGGGVPLDDLVSLANEVPVVRLVNLLILEALEARASDVHLEAYSDTLRVRYRIDGVLQEAPRPPGHLTAPVVSRLKIMADLDVAERRVPQDGRIRLRLQDRQVDVRVSTLPTLHGESVVLRLLDKDHSRGSLDRLGMGDDTLAAFARAIGRPHGIVLATGPTGSGKTTTLYAAIDRIRTGREKIVTVEDPVEYELVGVPQVPVNERVGVTFANALRALLRQDPDVMLVGEIRDTETAEIATNAALTGHLVLSTLHTNDAVGALTRLLDLGIPAYLIASTVEAVLAQRLVRLVCHGCGQWRPLTSDERRVLGPRADALTQAREGTGCGACRGSGFRGRTGMYELLMVTDGIRAALAHSDPVGRLRSEARADGMRELVDDGLRVVAAGQSTVAEVIRATGASG